MKRFIGTLVTLVSLNSVAFDHVSEVLPSGKILICKESDQVRNGESVENFRLKNFSSKFDKSKVKVNEFKLPLVGDKIKIFRITNLRKNKFETVSLNSEVGEAIVIEPNLKDELITKITYPFKGIHEEIQIAFSKAELESAKNDCILALPLNSAKFQNYDLVKF